MACEGLDTLPDAAWSAGGRRVVASGYLERVLCLGGVGMRLRMAQKVFIRVRWRKGRKKREREKEY